MKLWIAIVAFLSLGANASTFVGNGGGQGDMELAVTKKQVVETFTVIGEEDSEFCRCNPVYQNRSVCDALSSLTEEQRKFCSKVTRAQASEILKMLEPSSNLTIRWTNSSIEVNERGQTRAVDAVTDRNKKEITLNVTRFLEMKPYERVFLLTHELAHLTSYKGKPLEDEGAIGPFTNVDGGRKLLNAMGAGAAVLQGEYPQSIRTYKRNLNRSQPWKPRWLELNLGSTQFMDEPSETLASDRFKRGQVIARYNFGSWGVLTSFRHSSNDHTELETIKVNEQKDIASLGVSYRFFPFGEPLSFFGESHIQFQAMLDFVRAEINLEEELVTPLKDEATAIGGNISVNYYVPLVHGFWPYVGVAYEVHPYKYSKVNVDYKSNMTSAYLGVGYAF